MREVISEETFERRDDKGIKVSSLFTDAAAAVSDPTKPVADLSRSLLGLLDVDGASISSLGTVLSSETLSATDRLASRIDELQFDLGEGPCWDALNSNAPVLAPILSVVRPALWPAFTAAAREEGVCSVFAFPLRFGPIRLGAVDLYATTPTDLAPEDVKEMAAVTAALSRRVLANALQEAEHLDDDTESNTRYSRRLIHQASGVVLAQLNVSPEDAYLLIQGHAFAQHRTMRSVAEDLLERRLRFQLNDSGITVEEVPHD